MNGPLRCISVRRDGDWHMIEGNQNISVISIKDYCQIFTLSCSGGSVFIKTKGIGANKRYFMGGYYFAFNVFVRG